MNLPSFIDFARAPGAAWQAQHVEYVAMARECLNAARESYGIARKVHLRSARHYGKLARMTLQAASKNLPQGNGIAAVIHTTGHNERREGNCIKALRFNFLKKDGNAAERLGSGQNSHRGGNCIKALQQFSARKGPEGIAAGLSPWLDKCLSRTCVKAAPNHFLKRDGNEAGLEHSGQDIHREGNFIKALRFFISQRTARMMSSLRKLAAKVRSTSLIRSFSNIAIAPSRMSNLSQGGVL